jgi:hypothetical protein
MKTKIAMLFCMMMLILWITPARGQDSGSSGRKTIVYSFIINKVPDGFNFPLIGFLNFADGSHSSAHIGFFNWNQRDFNGLQLSFINSSGGEVKGSQTGFVNAAGGSFSGAQVGFVNATGGNFNGALAGFVNAVGGSAEGIKMGFVNACGGKTNGAQLAFVNVNGNSLKGLQAGFVNIARTIHGLQLGFVNLTDSIEKGFPLGFLSFIRKGGYKALELSANELYPFNLAFKTGVKGLYTSVIASWNPMSEEHYALGMGLGSMIPFSRTVYLNPEVTALGTYPGHSELYSLSLQLGFAISNRIHFALGPSLTWLNYNEEVDIFEPLFSFYEYSVNERNKLISGARVALRYNLSR